MFGDIKLIPQILLHPGEFFSKIGTQSIGELYKFWVVLCVFNLVLSIIFGVLALPFEFSMINFLAEIVGFSEILPSFTLGLFGARIIHIILNSIIGFIMNITFIFVLILFWALIVHIVAYIFGCRGYKKTLTALIIGLTPSMVLGPIPFIGFIAVLYSLILEIVGLSKLHKISNFKSLVILLLPGFILLLFVAGLGVLFYFGIQRTIGGPSPISCSPCFSSFTFVDYSNGSLFLRNGPQEIIIDDVSGGQMPAVTNYGPGDDIIISGIPTQTEVEIIISYTVLPSGSFRTDTGIIHT
jgi:hypothetical protein